MLHMAARYHGDVSVSHVCMYVCMYVLYSQKFWWEEYLADCSNNGIWRIILWRLGKPYTIIIFIAKWSHM